MPRLIDLTGQRFGRLVILKRIGVSTSGKPLWLCKCDCGNESEVNSNSLKNGYTKSCGCLRKETTATTSKKYTSTHGLSREKSGRKTRLFRIWRGIKYRCLVPTSKDYPNYGAKGITICDEWKDDFKAFHDWAMNNGYKSNLTIDRKENTGNYEPSNCRWVTTKQQNRNQSQTIYLHLNGKIKSLGEWSEITGINIETLRGRKSRGWSDEKTLTTKPKK